MSNTPLPILNVSIHFPSCKSNGFLSDEFAEEIKNNITTYEFKFTHFALPRDAFFPCGISGFSGENISAEESDKLMKVFCSVFYNLSLKQTK